MVVVMVVIDGSSDVGCQWQWLWYWLEAMVHWCSMLEAMVHWCSMFSVNTKGHEEEFKSGLGLKR